MAGSQDSACPDDIESHVWNLLTKDFRWQLPDDFTVSLHGDTAGTEKSARLQLFEVAIAKVFACLRPEYEWSVSENRPDGGLDFIGKHTFLADKDLGIAAAVTVGGQCKKRTRVDDIVDAISGSLAKMASSANPTFFVVAFSAQLRRARVDRAREVLEETHRRHCHILDRRQIEGLFRENISVLDDIFRVALSEEERDCVLAYFDAGQGREPEFTITVSKPDRVLAGVPFSVTLTLEFPLMSSSVTNLRWSPSGLDGDLTLIGPIGADQSSGAFIRGHPDSPMLAKSTLEMVTYSVGEVDLGEVTIDRRDANVLKGTSTKNLGKISVVENVRPRFFERPFKGPLTLLEQQYERALANGVSSIGVVGSGGSGKSRVCEEFSLEQRRRGASVLAAKQTKTLDDPYRIIAGLLLGLVDVPISPGDPADLVLDALESFDGELAGRAEMTIRSVLGTGTKGSGVVSEQDLLSSLLILLSTKARGGPLIVHLQDLHWCTADVLMTLERLIWQLDRTFNDLSTSSGDHASAVMFILEGRHDERDPDLEGDWSSDVFEEFLRKIDCPVAVCKSLDPADGRSFIARLFENGSSVDREISPGLLEVQHDLIDDIHRSAGGNPFHSLAQVQILKENSIIDQNPRSGLLYLKKPVLGQNHLPDSVFASIRSRWIYLRDRNPDLALLIWAAALLEDWVPMALFQRLRSELAPAVSLVEVDATEIVWTGSGESGEVSFRHENYFRSVRAFEIGVAERERVATIYDDWFGEGHESDPASSFKRARVLLTLPQPDIGLVRDILGTALEDARRQGNLSLARRIATKALDTEWEINDRKPLPVDEFLQVCRKDLTLARDLLGSDRGEAGQRLERLMRRVDRRLSSALQISAEERNRIRRIQVVATLLQCQFFFNDERSAVAAEMAARTIRGVQALRAEAYGESDYELDTIEMEALHTHAVALAISGELDPALERSQRAAAIARSANTDISPHIVSTYAAILLGFDPQASEVLLREVIEALDDSSQTLLDEAEINLGETLILLACRLEDGSSDRAADMLEEAEARLERVFSRCFRLGQYPDAGAAAVLLGVANAILGKGDQVYWFAQAVAAASRGRQMETLWRSEMNLATALHLETDDLERVRDHALAALGIIEATLEPYPDPERSPRFHVVSPALKRIVALLEDSRDEDAVRLLRQYPALRSSNVDRDRHHQWIDVGGTPFVLY